MTAETVFIDTNILVYAYDRSEEKKRRVCKPIIENCFKGKRKLILSNQILAEFSQVVTQKIPKPLPSNKVEDIILEINGIESWIKLDYSTRTVQRALKRLNQNEGKRKDFWDQLIGETMKENGYSLIYTENTKDFKPIRGVTPINPLKNPKE